MIYKIGDTVVYPIHGAGIIEGIEKKEILGQVKEYYVMQMPCSDMKVMIPVDNLEGIGIRGVVSDSEADNVIKFFRENDIAVNVNWNKRFRENMVKVKSGDLYEVASVVKSLMLRDKSKGLSTGERKMLGNAKQILISEIVIAKNSSNAEIEELLGNIVDEQLKRA